MRAVRIALAASLLAIALTFAEARPRLASALEFRRVGPDAVTLRPEPDTHAGRAVSLPPGARFHLSLPRRDGFVFVVADAFTSGWVAEEDVRAKTLRDP